jgi:regulator of cell morphogenesis and NO signaling
MFDKFNSIVEIISGNRLLESVIERFGINRRQMELELETACKLQGADPDFVLQVIKAFSDHFPFPLTELSRFPISQIVDYLKRTHKYYLEKKIPEIEQSFSFLCRDFSFSHPQLLVLASMFMEYKKELEEHIEVEEYVLFPYIGELLKVKEKKKDLHAFGLDKYSIDLFDQEHHHEEEVLTNIRCTIEGRFRKNRVPLPFRIFLNQIECLEKDLLKHSRIEDEVLLPLAKQLELEVKRGK